jgi:hypothetical protein
MAKRQLPIMRLVSPSQRRATKSYTRRVSEYNITDNQHQLPSVMQATSERIMRRLRILANAGLNPAKCNCLVCDAAIEAAERM